MPAADYSQGFRVVTAGDYLQGLRGGTASHWVLGFIKEGSLGGGHVLLGVRGVTALITFRDLGLGQPVILSRDFRV